MLTRNPQPEPSFDKAQEGEARNSFAPYFLRHYVF